MDNPFEMWVTNGDMTRPQRVNSILTAEFNLRHLALPSGTFSLLDSDMINARCSALDARMTVRFRGEHLMSGKLRNTAGKMLPGQVNTYQLQDDWRWLTNTLSWVQPANTARATSISAPDTTQMGQAWLPGGSSDAGPDGTIQGQYPYLYWPNGSAASGGLNITAAESAIKWLARINFDRLNRARAGARRYAIATDQSRGGDAQAAGILPQTRFDQGIDIPAVTIATWANLGISLQQRILGTGGNARPDTKVTLDVYQPRTIAQELTVESGIVVDGDWSLAHPNATRGVVGGPGDLAARAYTDFSDTALEAAYEDVIEVFREAQSVPVNWPSNLSEIYQVEKYYPIRDEISAANKKLFNDAMKAAGVQALADGVPTSGVSTTLSETASFRYGGPLGFHVGDQVTISSSAGKGAPLRFTDRITECSVKLDSDGLTVTPTVGNKSDDPNAKLFKAIVALARSQRRGAASR